MQSKRFKFVAASVWGLMFFVLDRVTKKLVLNFFFERKFLFNFQLNQNFVFGWSLSKAMIIIFASVTIVALFFFLIQTVRKQREEMFFLYLLIILGAFSNLLDRLLYGGVVDFIDLYFFPVFNLADIMITAGVILLVVFSWQNKDERVL